MESKYKKLGKNTVLVFVGQAGSSIVSMLMLPLYTSWLSTEEYGAVDLMSTYASILLSIVTCCVADSIFIFPKNANEEDKRKYFSSGLLFVIAISLFFVLINCFTRKLYDDFLKIYSFHTILLTVSMFLQKYAQQFTRCLEKMKVFATTGIVHTIGVALFSIILIPKYKLDGYIYALILSNLVTAIYTFFLSKSYVYFSFSAISNKHLKTLLVYGIPLIPNSIMWWLVTGLNRPIMETYLGLSAIGLFAVASKFPSIVSMVSSVFSNAWGISMLDEFGKPGFEVFFNKVFRLITFISFFVAFWVIIFSKQIIALFTTESFYDAWHVLPLLVIGSIINTSTGLVGGVFMALKKSKYFFYSSFFSAIASVTLTFLLIKEMGIFGCAAATTLSFAVGLILRIKFAWKYIKGFSIWRYFLSIILLLVLNLVLEASYGTVLKLLLYLSILFVMCFLYTKEIKSVIYKMSHIWKRF